MELQEALSGAIEYEHRIRDYYAECAKKVADSKGQRVFAILAREEQGHVTYLETRMAEWKAKGAVEEADLPTLLPPAAWVQAEAGKLAKRVDGAEEVAKAELDALKEALEMERRTSAFYAELVDKLDARHKGLFERFLEIENGHLSIVQAEIDA
ncbi:MAG TPA: ferritin family protein, partial [Holophaga sp.]|nr:ferritin family protein [Holophaga sp.]